MNRQKGYTIIELLISITLICLILVIIGLAMRLGFRSVDSGERRMGSLERFRASLNIVDAQIQSEMSIPIPIEAGDSYIFKGDKESMQFSSNYSLWSDQRGYVTVNYKVKNDEWGKQELHVEESTIGGAGRGDVRLFDFFDHIYFEYFYKGPTDEKGNWVDEWADSNTVPDKIRLHLINGRNETSFIIPVRVRDLNAVGVPAAPANPTGVPANATNG